jgi:hypothetical protein
MKLVGRFEAIAQERYSGGEHRVRISPERPFRTCAAEREQIVLYESDGSARLSDGSRGVLELLESQQMISPATGAIGRDSSRLEPCLLSPEYFARVGYRSPMAHFATLPAPVQSVKRQLSNEPQSAGRRFVGELRTLFGAGSRIRAALRRSRPIRF